MISPLAPETIAELTPLAGVRLGTVEAGIKFRGRADLLVAAFARPASVAGVFTRSKCPSAPVDWCRAHLASGTARCLVVNSGNANAFTGVRGIDAATATAQIAAGALGCSPSEVFLASTGVIGEPLDVSGFDDAVKKALQVATPGNWLDAARAIMTTDTYPKLAARSFHIANTEVTVNGIAKGSGMIAPDMATMLSFVATDAAVSPKCLQKIVDRHTATTFNAITVDSDTSTSDTVLAFATGAAATPLINNKASVGYQALSEAIGAVMHDLAMLVVRDGEGASKHVEITVEQAESDPSARRVAFAVANSPLVKTAIAGEDANWGRIVMAVGKAGEAADRDQLAIHFGDVQVAANGERDPNYSEEAASAVMKKPEIAIRIALGVGSGRATVWTCDLTHDYISINGDYRS